MGQGVNNPHSCPIVAVYLIANPDQGNPGTSAVVTVFRKGLGRLLEQPYPGGTGHLHPFHS